MINRIDKVVEQYRDKDMVQKTKYTSEIIIKHQSKKSKTKFIISASSERDDYNYKKRNRANNMGKYINENQFKIDYTRKIKFLIK